MRKVSLIAFTATSFVLAEELCLKQAYNRGAGSVPEACLEGYEEYAFLCYPPCPAGYTSSGSLCTSTCPNGFVDIGLMCLKPSAYERGVGYPLFANDQCLAENPQGCDECASLWYAKCVDGFEAVGCNLCTPACPDTTVDVGTGCEKDA